MDAVWSREFLWALFFFMAPTAVAAGCAYRWIVRSTLCRPRAPRKAAEALRPVPEKSEPKAKPAADPESVRESLENLRKRLVEFQAAIQRAHSALGVLQECDCRCSVDLTRAREALRRPFSKNAEGRGISSAA